MYNRKKYDSKIPVSQKIQRAVHALQMQEMERADANESIFIARELEQFMTELQRVEYADLQARNVIPVDSSINRAARVFTYKILDGYGKAKVIDDYATDFPNVELKGAPQSGWVCSIGDSYQFSYQDLREATYAGFDLENEKAALAHRVMEESIDQIAAFGNGGLVTGLFNAPGGSAPPILNAATAASLGLGAPINFETTITADPINGPQTVITYLSSLIKFLWKRNKGKFMGRGLTLTLGSGNFATITSTKAGPYTDLTIAGQLQKLFPTMLAGLEYWNALDTAAPSSKERLMLAPKDPSVFRMTVPQEFEQFAPQVVGLVLRVPCHARIGTTQIRVPGAILFVDGTQG